MPVREHLKIPVASDWIDLSPVASKVSECRLWLQIQMVSLARSLVRYRIPAMLYRFAMNVFYCIRSVAYAGEEFICPCCGGRFSTFVRYGKNRECPGCGSFQRHRLLSLYLHNETDIFSMPMKLLYVAPERGLHAQFTACSTMEHVSIDLGSPLAEMKMDVTDLKFHDNTFDAILCYHVLEKVADDGKALSEFHRVLKPGGWAIIQSPIETSLAYTWCSRSVVSPLERAIAYGEYDDCRLYGLDYYDRLEQAGFDVSAIDYVRTLDPETIRRNVLRKDSGRFPEELCIARKP
ncbi:MAG TPA: methyltransferase domain-containing protein [Desulfomonilaceae bacterium]|nr:methyltransferase domain-containing protein [Desulfomonilaceae bacterium]